MTYNIFSSTAPAMPKPAKGTEIVKLLLSQVLKDMFEPLVPMFFPVFGAHISGAEFQYPDNSWKDRRCVPCLQTPYFDREGRLVGIQNCNLILGGSPRFRFPQGSSCTIYNLPINTQQPCLIAR